MRTATAAELVSAAIDAAEHEGPALVVGIDGAGGAGKSALARELALLRDDVAIIEGDDFYRPLTESTREALTPLEAVDLLFDWERLRDEALAPLAARRRGALPPLRLGRPGGSARRSRPWPPRASSWSRACYVARPALRGYLDLIVVVEPRASSASSASSRAARTSPSRSRAGAPPRSGTSSGRIRGAWRIS